MNRQNRVPLLLAAAVAMAACVHRARPFDQHFDASRWSEASDAFVADSSLMNDERALYRAGILYGTPGRSTFRPERADSLFRYLLTRFPETKYRNEAVVERATLGLIIRQRDSVIALERRLADLSNSVRVLRMRLDSAATQTDSLRRSSSRLEADLRDRDEQLRNLRLELQRLKEIDLKREPPGRRPPD